MGQSMQLIQNIPFFANDGRPTSLAQFRGQVLLLVNVASRCGLTPQYAALQKLYAEKHPEGLTIIGFPANDFGGQEPGSDQEIHTFCSTTYDITFPLAAKVSVKGNQQHPLYAALINAQPQAEEENPGAMAAKLQSYGHQREHTADILWNFEKFLIGRDGRVRARFGPDVAPDAPILTHAIEAALKKS